MAQTIKGRKRSRRGLAMMDVLAATLIITVTMIGTLGIFFRILNLTSRTVEASTASNLARRTVEDAKVQGFDDLPDGTTTKYYNLSGASLSSSTGSTFKVVMVVATDVYDPDGTPSDKALRSILVTVSRQSDSTALETTGTYLAKGGS